MNVKHARALESFHTPWQGMGVLLYGSVGQSHRLALPAS